MATIKTAEELALIRRAAKITQEVFARALNMIHAGVTERELAAKMEELAWTFDGVSGLAFPPIIASGPNGAQPHAEVTDRVFVNGDMITVDFGVTAFGYASDMTRTFLIGRPPHALMNIYGAVKRAQAAGLSAARPGMACAELDAVCRDIIEAEGYGEYFVHTTGHGVGTEVHEDPRIGKNSDTLIETGMVITIEPGVYIEGLGGVRIEDTAIITATGCEVITSEIPKYRIPVEQLIKML